MAYTRMKAIQQFFSLPYLSAGSKGPVNATANKTNNMYFSVKLKQIKG